MKGEGIGALYKGFLPTWSRMVSVMCSLCEVFGYIYYATTVYRIQQNFCRLKFSLKAHTLYWDKNFANHANYLPGSSGWSSQVIGMRICACAHDLAQNSVCQISLCKKFTEKIFVNCMHWWNWRKFSPGENFHIYGITICVHVIIMNMNKSPSLQRCTCS